MEGRHAGRRGPEKKMGKNKIEVRQATLVNVVYKGKPPAVTAGASFTKEVSHKNKVRRGRVQHCQILTHKILTFIRHKVVSSYIMYIHNRA